MANEERGFNQVLRSCRSPSGGENIEKEKEHLSLDSLSSCSFINYYYYYYYYNMWARPSATPKKVGWANISPTFIFQFFLKGRV
jgi:hypothetical protein